MIDSYQAFTSHHETIGEFLTQARKKDHGDVIYMRFPPNGGLFEDQQTRSIIFIEYSGADGVSEVGFSLHGDTGLIHDWVRMFREDWGATVVG